MISAVSSALSAALNTTDTTSTTGRRPADASGGQVGYAWVKGLPDLNRTTRRQIGASGAGWTFTTICSLLHHVGRVGRPHARKAARDDQRLSVGVQAIADESGLSINKVRRDLKRLAETGVITVARPNVTVVRDLATGQITENRTGRSKATVVFLTICPEHLRVKAAPVAACPPRMAPPNPPRMAGLPAPDSVHSGRAIQRETKTERTPDGLADGVGRPPAEEAGLPAGGPAGRLAPQAKRPTPPPWPGRRPDEGHRTAAEAAAQWERVDPETVRRREEYRAAKAAKAARMKAETAAAPPVTPERSFDHHAAKAAALAALGQQAARPASDTTTADEAADGLQRASEEYLGNIEDEARRLAEIIERRRREEAEPAGSRRGREAGAAA